MSKSVFPFYKYHALGNDYIVLNKKDCGELSAEDIVRICHRNFGIGSDGILLDTQVSPDSDFSLQIFNPDGGQAEKSGNGLRIFSRYLWDHQRVGEQTFEIQTLGGRVKARVLDAGAEVRVEMGEVSFESSKIPMTGEKREVISENLALSSGEVVEVTAANIGNPHCIVLDDNPSQELARRIGPLIETHQSFPERTNVQFAKAVSRNVIALEIWERGAGYTLASGSSASATAAVLHRLGLVDREITAVMPGGNLKIVIGEDYQIQLQGSVTRVASGELFSESLEFSVDAGQENLELSANL